MLSLRCVHTGKEAEISSLTGVPRSALTPPTGVRSGLRKLSGTSIRAERVANEIAKAFRWRRLWGCS